MSLGIAVAAIASVALLFYRVCWSLFWSPLARIPGPKSFALTRWRLAREDYKGTRTRTIHRLHQAYGPVVRIGPNEVAFNSMAALRQIYGAGSPFGRPGSFYRVFDVYGRPHMFTFYSSSEHAGRKRALSQMYSKSAIMKSPVSNMIQSKVKDFVDLIESDPQTASHLAKSLHYYSLDNITWMVYRDFGAATAALTGQLSDRQILNDIEQLTARRYSWFQTHLPRYTAWAMSSSSQLRSILGLVGLLPGKKPLAYSGLQDYALATFKAHRNDGTPPPSSGGSLTQRLLHEQAVSREKNIITDLDIAAECADHLDAGLKTTSDTLLFALWVLSLPGHQHYQQRLAAEVDALKDVSSDVADIGSISPADLCDRLPFLDAILKETLRLYAPIPASQPRASSTDVTVDGYVIPAGTIVSCQAYSLHRNQDVFREPLKFNPDRWLVGDAEELAEMRRWWWPFSSGGRMCLGMHLALAEMKTLLVAIFQRYSTSVGPDFQGMSPTATSRFELVYDDILPVAEGKECVVHFRRRL